LWLAGDITSLRNIGPPLTPQRDHPRLLSWLVAGFSLISRCTHRAHAAFQLFEKPKLSFQSIMGKLELTKARLKQFGQQRDSSQQKPI
jgi:hypothetical protein